MPSRHLRIPGRAVWLAGAGLLALTVASMAKDLPATPAGAKKITDFVATYGGKSAATAKGFSVTPDGAGYAVRFDMGTISFPTATGGSIGYDPAIFKLRIVEQDDGLWRVEQNEYPPMTAHGREGDKDIEAKVTIDGAQASYLIDPATSWIKSHQGKFDKIVVDEKLPGVVEKITMSGSQFSGVGVATPDGVGSLESHGGGGAMSVSIVVDPSANPKAKPDAKPVNIKVDADKLDAAVQVDGLKIKPFFELWAFLVAHATRPELAADEAKLKTLALAAVSSQLTLSESLGMPKMTVKSEIGDIGLGGLKVAFALASTGPTSKYETHISVTSLSLPPGLLPPAYASLIPTSFDVGAKVGGFDATAAGIEAINDMHLAGDGDPISTADSAKVMAKLTSVGPVTIDIPSSHVVAPKLDVTFEGKITYDKGKPAGMLKVRVKDFDKTIAAAKALGADAEKQIVPVAAMAKGLAKTEADGTLTWVAEVGADKVIKVNGLPLGKAPF